MFIKTTTEVEPSLFSNEQRNVYSKALIEVVSELEQANDIISAYTGFNPEDTLNAAIQNLDLEGGEPELDYNDLARILGKESIDRFAADLHSKAGDIPSKEIYEEAVEARTANSTRLIDYTCGYYQYIHDNLVAVYGKEDENIEEDAWKATWKNIQSVLLSAEGTLLAEATRFFDEAVKEKFGKDYRAMEEDRGPVVAQDISARIFYEVMQDHLPRAIIGANRDEWTGYQ